MKEIRLTQGKFALVDDEDFERARAHKWCVTSEGKGFRVARNIRMPSGKKRLQYLHRFLLGDTDGIVVDHVNGNGLDNRRENLRMCSQADNVRNKRKGMGTSSAFKGVCFAKRYQKWVAMVMRDRKSKFLGYFTDEVEAAKAYDGAARQYFGEFAALNFPLPGEIPALSNG